MVQWGRTSGRQPSDGYQSVCRCISERYCWSRKTGGLEGYHLLGGSSGRLVIRARALGDKGMVVTYLEENVVRISSVSVEGRGITTSRFSASIEGNLLTTENKPQQYIRIGKLFYFDSIRITFCA